ncbi:MAG: polysaccharide deacetylase family protein [Deltaproteobacteria bacterium]|nr:polysaccharide deacetylase family protein [Deltaproteobacteria bacterium]
MTGKEKEVPFLLYHAVEPDERSMGSWNESEKIYVITADSFEEQLAYLRERNFQSILVNDFLGWIGGKNDLPENPVLLSFDDGHVTNETVALPLLLKYGYKAEFFITTGNAGSSGWLTAERIRKLRSSGMGIGSHAVAHRYLTDLDEHDINCELKGSKRFLEDCLGEAITSFSPPGGRITRRIANIAEEAGYKAVCNSRLKRNSQKDSALDLGRIPVKNGLKIGDFRKIMLAGPLRIDILRNYIAGSAKTILGNDLYDRFREVVLGKNH